MIRIIYGSYNGRIILLVVYLYVAEAATLLTAHYTIETLTLIIQTINYTFITRTIYIIRSLYEPCAASRSSPFHKRDGMIAYVAEAATLLKKRPQVRQSRTRGRQ